MEGSSRSVREIQGATHSAGKNDFRRIKEIMARGTSRSILKDPGGFCPWFSHRSFELKCPELDDSMLRRLRMEHSREKAAMETKEKSLLLNQKKFLDIGNPIIEV